MFVTDRIDQQFESRRGPVEKLWKLVQLLRLRRDPESGWRTMQQTIVHVLNSIKSVLLQHNANRDLLSRGDGARMSRTSNFEAKERMSVSPTEAYGRQSQDHSVAAASSVRSTRSCMMGMTMREKGVLKA